MDRRDFLYKAALGTGTFLLPNGLLKGNPVHQEYILQHEGTDPVVKKRLADFVLQLAESKGASYADVRFGQTFTEQITASGRLISNVSHTESAGVGIRVVVEGCTGFVSKGNVSSEEELGGMVERAVEIARINKKLKIKPTRLAPQEALGAVNWKTPVIKDVFTIPVSEKKDLLLHVNDAAISNGAGYIESMLYAQKQHKYFASSDGSYIEQEIHRFWPAFCVAAGEGGDFQTRKALSSPVGKGYEYLQKNPADKASGIVTLYRNGYDMVEDAIAAAVQVKQKLSARSVEAGQYDLVIDPSALWNTIHHTIGYNFNPDIIAGDNAAQEGSGFLDLEKWKSGEKSFGSRYVSFLADRTQPGTLGAAGYDDEGIRSKQWTLVRDGNLESFFSGRSKNQLIDESRSHGCGAAEDWDKPVMLRMPNISLAPGKAPLTATQLIDDVKKGIYVVGDGHFSMDQQGLNFQSGGQLFYEIENGQVKGMLKDTAFQSNTRDFWNSCTQICDRRDYRFGGTLSDKSGQPEQLHAVSHGCATSRFNGIQVLNTRNIQVVLTGAEVH